MNWRDRLIGIKNDLEHMCGFVLPFEDNEDLRVALEAVKRMLERRGSQFLTRLRRTMVEIAEGMLNLVVVCGWIMGTGERQVHRRPKPRTECPIPTSVKPLGKEES